MAKFMLAYHGGEQPKTKEEGAAHMERWKSWVSSLGDKVLNPGTPLVASKTINKDGEVDLNQENCMNGFAIIKAESLQEALKIAQEDPFLQMNGQIRVSQMMEMP